MGSSCLGYVEDVQYLLEFQPQINPEDLHKVYRYLTSGSRGILDNEKNIADFIDFYGNSFLEVMQSNIDYKTGQANSNWLLSTLREKYKYSPHPLRHLLIIRWLRGSLKQFLTEYDSLFAEVRKSESSLSIYNSPPKRNLQESYCIKVRQERKMTEYRAHVLTLLAQSDIKTRTDLRKRANKEYAWLTRYDKEWFESALPKAIVGRDRIAGRKQHVDWKQRDHQAVTLIESAISELKRLPTPVRITVNRIAKNIGQTTIVYISQGKLPLAGGVLKEKC